jgi:hypothetical protein
MEYLLRVALGCKLISITNTSRGIVCGVNRKGTNR